MRTSGGGPFGCPKCGHGFSSVLDSRPNETRDAIRRRRECLGCEHRWSTLEVFITDRGSIETLLGAARQEQNLKDLLTRIERGFAALHAEFFRK